MSAQIINLACLKIQDELDKFDSNSLIPASLLNGEMDINEIIDYIPALPGRHQEIAQRLIEEYTLVMDENLSKIKQDLRSEYTRIMKRMHTGSDDFRVPDIMLRYRSDINPVKAMYYEIRELVSGGYDRANQCHIWLVERFTCSEFSDRILKAIEHDQDMVSRFVNKYYWTVTKLDQSSIPLELFHARQLAQDLNHYHRVFSMMRDWNPGDQLTWV